MPEYYTSTGRYDLSTGDILDVETNLPLSNFDLPDFFRTGNRVSSNLLYDLETTVGSYYIDPVNKFYPEDPPSGSLEFEKEKIGINSIWKTDFDRSLRNHDYYTWTGLNFSGDIEGMATVLVGGLPYSGFSEGTLTGGYDAETGESPTITFSGQSTVLVTRGTSAFGGGFSNFANTFFSGLRGSVNIVPLVLAFRNNPFVDAETETGRAYLTGFLATGLNVGGSAGTKKFKWLKQALDRQNSRDRKVFLLRDSDTSTFDFGEDGAGVFEQDIIDQIQALQIPVYDYYNTSTNTAASNPLSGITTFSSGYSPSDNAYVDQIKRIPEFVNLQNINMIDGAQQRWLAPADTFQVDTSLYTYTGSGLISGERTGEITGGIAQNIIPFFKPVLLRAKTYGMYYEDKFRGTLDLSISGNISFKNIFEEYFFDNYFKPSGNYGIKVSGTNSGDQLVTGDIQHVPYSGEPYVEGGHKETSVNFNDFCVVAPVNLNGYAVSFASSVTVTGTPSVSGEVYLVSGLLDVDSTLNTGITGEFDFFDVNFVSGDPIYFSNTNGSTGMLSGDVFHTYLLSNTGGVSVETSLSSAVVLPTGMPDLVDTFSMSIDPFFSRSISGDQVVSGITEERVEDLLPPNANIERTTTLQDGTGRVFISGIFQGDMTYTGIYYKDDDAITGFVNPAHDYHYKISDLSNFSLNNLTGDGKVRVVDDSGEEVTVSEDISIIFLFDRSGSMLDDIRDCSAAIAASELFNYRIIDADIYSYLGAARHEFGLTNMVFIPGLYEEMQATLNTIPGLFSVSGGVESLSQAIIDLDNDGKFDKDHKVILCVFTDEVDNNDGGISQSPTTKATAQNILLTKDVRTFIFAPESYPFAPTYPNLKDHFTDYLSSLSNESSWVELKDVDSANFGVLIETVANKGFANLDVKAILEIDNQDLNDYLPELFFKDAEYSQEIYRPPSSLYIRQLEIRAKTTRGGEPDFVDDDFAILRNGEIIVSPARNIMWYSHQPPYSVYVVGGKLTTASGIDYNITNVSNNDIQIFEVTNTWDGRGEFVVSYQERIDEIEALGSSVVSSSLELVVVDAKRVLRAWNAKPLPNILDDENTNSLSVGVFSKPVVPPIFNISTEGNGFLRNAANRGSSILGFGAAYNNFLAGNMTWPYLGAQSGFSSPEYVWRYDGEIFPEDTLEVAVFDGWGNKSRLVPWTALLYWNDGFINRINGGYLDESPSVSGKIISFEQSQLSRSEYLSEDGGGPWGESYVFYSGGSGLIPITRDIQQDFVQDMAYLQYDTSGVPFNIAQGVGFSVRYQETVTSDDPLFVGENSKPKVDWKDVGFICDLDFLNRAAISNNEDKPEEPDDDDLCDPPPGCPGTDVGAAEGERVAAASARANTEEMISGAFYSGSIKLNKLAVGDYLEFSPYNFDYSGEYLKAYGTGFPDIYNLDNKFYYDRIGNSHSTFNNAVDLAYLLNGYYNNFSLGVNKRGIWQFFKTGISEFAGDTSGDFYNGPLLKATAISTNFLRIESLIFGEMGNYKIEFDNSYGVPSTKYQYSMPVSLAFQGSYDAQSWKNLMLKEFDFSATDHEIISDALEITTEPIEFREGAELRVDDEKNASDLITITSSDHVIQSGNSGAFLNSVESNGITFINSGTSIFTGTEFPSGGIDVSDYNENSIRYEYSGNHSGALLGSVIGYKVLIPEEEEEPELPDGFVDILPECPLANREVITRTKTIVIDSGVDQFGNIFQITQDQSQDCSGCRDFQQIEVPFGHPINSGKVPTDADYVHTGFVKCKTEGAETESEDPTVSEITVSYSGFFTGFEGEDIFSPNNTFFRGSFTANKNPEPLFEIPEQNAVYPISEASLFFNDISIFPFDDILLDEDEISSDEEVAPSISLRTGFIFDNEIDYRYYRLLYSGFSIITGVEGCQSQSGTVIFDEVNLYGPTNYSFTLSGAQDITLFDATYSGDLEVQVTGSITGTHVGTSASGILSVNEVKTGIINSEFFHNGQQIFATDFFANYTDTISGIGLASGNITGLFYDTGTNELINEIPVVRLVTGFTNVEVEVNEISDVTDIVTDEEVFIDITADARFTGLGNVKALQSGINSFAIISGLETGFINDGSGSFDFFRSESVVLPGNMLLQNQNGLLTEDSDNLKLEGIELDVFGSTPTGYISAQAILNYNNPIIGDRIILGNNGFVNSTGNALPNLFNDITGLSNVINSGDSGFTSLIVDSDTLQIFANALGELGNSIQVNSIGSGGRPTFESDTFTGGKNIHQSLTGYGLFTGSSTETVNNTGIYEVDYTGEITGTINIFTGLKTFTGTFELFTGRSFKDISFRDNIPDGTVTSIYDQGFTQMGIFPSQFNTYIDYVPSDLIDYSDTNNEPDVAELIITGINLTGYRIPIHGDE